MKPPTKTTITTINVCVKNILTKAPLAWILKDGYKNIFQLPDEKAAQKGILSNALFRYGQGNGKGEAPNRQNEEPWMKNCFHRALEPNLKMFPIPRKEHLLSIAKLYFRIAPDIVHYCLQQ